MIYSNRKSQTVNARFFDSALERTLLCAILEAVRKHLFYLSDCSAMFEFLTQKMSSLVTLFSSKHHFNEKDLKEAIAKVEDAFFQADVPYQVVKAFTQQISDAMSGHKLLGKLNAKDVFVKIVHDKLKFFMGNQNEFAGFQIPSTIMVLGLQGSGKTTSLIKMAWHVKTQAEQRGKSRRIVCTSVDFYRPAAVEQLAILAQRAGVDFYRPEATTPLEAARESMNYMRKAGYDHLFLDTAGRLHIDQPMLAELRSIDEALKPRYKIFVLDAMIGQESLNVAQAFDQGVGFNAAFLSKTDSDTRGGAAFAFKYMQKKPLFFVGTGERPEDLELFHPDRMAGKILGMGDIVSLAEKAERVIKQDEQTALNQALSSGSFTLQDFADQITMVNSLGSLSSLARYLPGIGTQMTPDMLEKGEQDLKKFKAIIGSMTMKERAVPRILVPSRIERIARGAGVQPGDVKFFLRRFEESQQYAKLFKRFLRAK